MRIPLVSLILVACGGPPSSLDESAARKAVESAFAAANPAGRTGMELKGKSVWLQGPWFDASCLESKDLAFNEKPGGNGGGAAKISPTFQNQRWITASTPKGYCVVLGESPTLSLTEAKWEGGAWRMKGTVGIGAPSPWFECISEQHKAREFIVKPGVGEGAAPVIEGDLDLRQGDCPSPLPGGEERGPTGPAPAEAHAAPSIDEVRALIAAFDQALVDGKLVEARAMTACYNLAEEPPVYGACSVGELVAHGPTFLAEARPQDGTPWLEYAATGPDGFTRVVKDGRHPSMAHALVKHKRTGKDRSVSVVWADGGWKLVGVVFRKAEALTTARYLNDLHDSKKRDIFERRFVKGEKIDDQGVSTEDPDAAAAE